MQHFLNEQYFQGFKIFHQMILFYTQPKIKTHFISILFLDQCQMAKEILLQRWSCWYYHGLCCYFDPDQSNYWANLREMFLTGGLESVTSKITFIQASSIPVKCIKAITFTLWLSEHKIRMNYVNVQYPWF